MTKRFDEVRGGRRDTSCCPHLFRDEVIRGQRHPHGFCHIHQWSDVLDGDYPAASAVLARALPLRDRYSVHTECPRHVGRPAKLLDYARCWFHAANVAILATADKSAVADKATDRRSGTGYKPKP